MFDPGTGVADRCQSTINRYATRSLSPNPQPSRSGPTRPIHVCFCLLLLFQADEEFSRQCLEQQTAHLRGPPNCPTDGSLTCEQGGLLRTALEFLSEQAGRGRDSSDGGGAGVSRRQEAVESGDTSSDDLDSSESSA